MRFLVSLAVAASLTGCVGWGDEPFSERTIVGKYRLKSWEDGAFYLRMPTDTGTLMPDEPVQRIGWDSAHVLVLRGERGHAPEWSVIDVATGWIRSVDSPPATDTGVGRIQTMTPDSAWARLSVR